MARWPYGAKECRAILRSVMTAFLYACVYLFILTLFMFDYECVLATLVSSLISGLRASEWMGYGRSGFLSLSPVHLLLLYLS